MHPTRALRTSFNRFPMKRELPLHGKLDAKQFLYAEAISFEFTHHVAGLSGSLKSKEAACQTFFFLFRVLNGSESIMKSNSGEMCLKWIHACKSQVQLSLASFEPVCMTAMMVTDS
ncbi:hypothetical protein TNIN_326821 [Trichonephila inaurata madagascariensis]|uniref:Uncharacterized protein n=1 Tax=Trichonephila inaurata madagascariensis TaxID=2747483 RepID=A0A8X6YV40_9ARAC|nr:hypothetical protein TNIN_326821 [Trichonephila inaurata madagascariensis]